MFDIIFLSVEVFKMKKMAFVGPINNGWALLLNHRFAPRHRYVRVIASAIGEQHPLPVCIDFGGAS